MFRIVSECLETNYVILLRRKSINVKSSSGKIVEYFNHILFGFAFLNETDCTLAISNFDKISQLPNHSCSLVPPDEINKANSKYQNWIS